MQFKELWSALRRRWYLLLVALMLAGGGAVGVVKMVGPTYETQGAVLILPPGTSGSGTSQVVGNPFLSLAGVSQVRDVVIRTMMSKTFLEELCSTTGDAAYETMTGQMCRQSPAGITFEATPDFTSGAPMILITVKSETPETGGTALEAIADRVPGILTDLQAGLGLRPKGLVGSTPVVMDFQPDVVHKTQIRAGLVAGVGLLGLGLLAVALIDATLQRRRIPEEGTVSAAQLGDTEASADWGQGPDASAEWGQQAEASPEWGQQAETSLDWGWGSDSSADVPGGESSAVGNHRVNGHPRGKKTSVGARGGGSR